MLHLQMKTTGPSGAAGAPALLVVGKETDPEEELAPHLTQQTV